MTFHQRQQSAFQLAYVPFVPRALGALLVGRGGYRRCGRPFRWKSSKPLGKLIDGFAGDTLPQPESQNISSCFGLTSQRQGFEVAQPVIYDVEPCLQGGL